MSSTINRTLGPTPLLEQHLSVIINIESYSGSSGMRSQLPADAAPQYCAFCFDPVWDGEVGTVPVVG